MKWRICFCILIALILACDEDDGSNELEISIPVSVAEVKKGDIQEFVTSSGTVDAIEAADLASEIEGRYRLAKNPKTGKPFAPGDAVTKGQTIIYLDNPEFENNTRIESRKLNLDISKREFEKQQSLYEKGGVTLRELKNAESSYIDSRYNYDNARLELDKLTITAPFSGIITDLPYFTPNVRVPAATQLAQVMNYSRLFAEIKFPAKEITRVRSGQTVRISHYSLEGDTLNGAITRVSPAIDKASRSFKALVEVDNSEHLFRPGMFVKINAVVSEKSDVVIIPKEIIISRQRGNIVYVVDKGAAFERVVEIGLENASRVEVLDGLETGDRLIVKGYETLRERSKVKVVK